MRDINVGGTVTLESNFRLAYTGRQFEARRPKEIIHTL